MQNVVVVSFNNNFLNIHLIRYLMTPCRIHNNKSKRRIGCANAMPPSKKNNNRKNARVERNTRGKQWKKKNQQMCGNGAQKVKRRRDRKREQQQKKVLQKEFTLKHKNTHTLCKFIRKTTYAHIHTHFP